MQDVGFSHDFTYLAVAANDNEDLLSFAIPTIDLALIRTLKRELREENAQTGILLSSAKARHFFQEILDAERYITLRYFTAYTPESILRELKRYILDHYLFPKKKRGRRKTAAAPKNPTA